MFGIKHNECIGFESRWKVKKVSYEGSSQTDDYKQKEIATSTTNHSEIEVQTDPLFPTQKEVDMQQLSEWLTKIYPSVLRELDDGTNSKAFIGYHLSETEEAECKLTQNIKLFPEKTDNSAIQVSDITWNITGRTLAVACSKSHQTWCNHQGCVLLYVLDRNTKFPENPSKKMTTDSCVTSIKFHPTLPSILAAGTYSGGIIIYDIRHEKGNGILISIDDRNTVSQLYWIIKPTDSDFLAVSSVNGYLSMWKFSETEPKASFSKRFKIKSPLFKEPKKDSPKHQRKNFSFGILCFDFSKFVPDTFVVGLEGGLVVECSLVDAIQLKGTNTLLSYDPSHKFYVPHQGNVTYISFSPNNRELFITSATDFETRIYALGQEEPVRTIFKENMPNPFTWIPHEKNLICIYGINNTFDFYDIRTGQSIINTQKKSKNSEDNSTLAQININTTLSGMVAVGTNKNSLEIWNVPWSAFSKLATSK